MATHDLEPAGVGSRYDGVLREAFAAFDHAARQLGGGRDDIEREVARMVRELAQAAQDLQGLWVEKSARAERIAASYAVMPIGLVIVDADACVVDANPAAERMLGIPLAGRNWKDIATERLAGSRRKRTGAAIDGAGLRVSGHLLEGGLGRCFVLDDSGGVAPDEFDALLSAERTQT